MQATAHRIRPFVGSRNYCLSQEFYRALGFVVTYEGGELCYLSFPDGPGFYLQDYYVGEWVENSMLFLEVADPEAYHAQLLELNLPARFPGVRISAVETRDWGREFFLHDPSGVLWHVGRFGE